MASRSLAVRLTSDLSGLSAGLNKGQQHVRGFAASIESVGGRASAVFGRLGATIAGAIGVAGVGSALGFGIKLAADAEQAEVAFGVMLGSADKAKQSLADLTQFAAETPFEFPELRTAAQKLLAFGTSAGSLIPTMRQLGDIAAGVGMPIAELAELYGKAQVQGRIMAEDINQLTGRGIPIIQELARQFGVNESQVRKLVETGQVGFPNIQQAFVDLTSEGSKFGGMMDAQSKTLGGLWSTFTDNVGIRLRGVGEQLIETFDVKALLDRAIGGMEAFGGALVVAARELAPLVQLALRFGPALLAARGAIALVNVAIRTYTTLQKAAASATIITQAVMGPAGWIKVAAGLGAAGLAIGAMGKLLGDAEAKAKKTDAEVGKLGRQAAGLGGVADEAARLAGNLGLAAESPAELGRQVESLFAKLSAAKNMLADTTPAVAGYAAEYGQVASGQARGFSSADQARLLMPEGLGREAAELDRELLRLAESPGKIGEAARRAFVAFDAAIGARGEVAELAEALEAGGMSIDQWEQGQQDLDAASREYLATVTAQVTAIGELEREVQAAIDVFGSLEEAWKFGQKVNEDLRSAGDAIDETARKIQGLVDLGLLDPGKETAALESQLEKAFSGVDTTAKLMDAQSALNDLYREGVITAEQLGTLGDSLGAGFDRAIGGPQAYLDDLAGRVETLKNGWTDAQAEIERFAATPGVTAAQVDAMRSLNKELERLQEGDRLKKQGESLVEQFRTPEEKLRAQAADLERLLAVGAIDLGTAQRAWQSYAASSGGGQVQSPAAREAGSREAYSAMVRHQAGRAEMPPHARDQLAKLERIARATEGVAKKEDVVEEVDI